VHRIDGTVQTVQGNADAAEVEAPVHGGAHILFHTERGNGHDKQKKYKGSHIEGPQVCALPYVLASFALLALVERVRGSGSEAKSLGDTVVRTAEPTPPTTSVVGSINAIATLCASVPVAAEAAGATPETAVACTAVARKISESVAPPHQMDAMNGGVRGVLPSLSVSV